MDKAGPSGDYDASNTSIRDSKTSTLIIDEVYDVQEDRLNRLIGIRRGLNLPECLPISPKSTNIHKVSITDRSDLSSCSQASPNSTFRFGSVNNKFRSTKSFNLIEDLQQQNSTCSRPDSATTENSSINNFFICPHNTDFTNPNNNCDQSKSYIDPFSSPELRESIGNSPIVQKTHSSCDDVKIAHKLSSCELRPVHNWSAPVGQNRQDCGGNILTARCLEVPPKRKRIGLNTLRYPVVQSSATAVMQSCCDCEILELQEVPGSAKVVQIRNYEFRGCLSAVDGQCESLASPKPRTCKSKIDNHPLTVNESSIESTQYIKSSTGESFSQICKEIQQGCLNFDENTLDNKINLESQLMFLNGTSNSQSTTSYELSEAAKTESYLPKSNSNKFSEPEDLLFANEQEWSTYPTVNRLVDDFNGDSDKCSHCQCLDSSVLNDHYSLSRPTSYTSCDNTHLKINIPSSAEDDEFVNAAYLEPNITTIESGKYHHHQQQPNKFRFWRFKRRKDRLGSGDTSATSEITNSDSQRSKSYIVSPVDVKIDSKLKLGMIKNCEKPNVKTKRKNLESKSGHSTDFAETELSTINYSDFCLPIKSLDQLPDEKSVQDILQTMSQSVFKKHRDSAVDEVDSIGDCNDLKEDLILNTFSHYSQFKTRAELLAEHLNESKKDKEEHVNTTELSKIIKEATFPLPPSSSDDNSEANYYLNRRKPQNTQIRFYEIPSPMNSNANLNQRDDDSEHECKHEKNRSDDTVVKINDDEEDDDISTGFCANCFCKHLLFPKMSRSYFL